MKPVEAILFTLFLTNIFLIGYFFIFEYQKPSVECLNNPLIYGANKLQESNKYPVECSCKVISPNPAPTLVFNHNSSSFVNPPSLIVERSFPEINFSFDFGEEK